MFKSLKFLTITIIITMVVSLICCVDPVYGYGQYMEYFPGSNYYNYYQPPTQIEPTQYVYHYYHPQQTQLYLPPGSYYDERSGMLQPFPGGGIPIFIDYYKRCSRNFLGIKAHPVLPQYYYVCKIDSVIFGKCHNLQIFNSTINQCVLQPTPDYIPNCKMAGLYPIYSDCHIYYKCNDDLKMEIYICPNNMTFSPNERICVLGNECKITQIIVNDTQIVEKTSEDFPICLQIGTYRSPIDCSLYYTCDMQPNGIFLQTRYKCPSGMFYDTSNGKCLPKHKVLCDCIPIAWFTTQYLPMRWLRPGVGSVSRPIPLPLTVQQSHFDSDTLEDVNYPTEAFTLTTMPTGNGEISSIENIEMHDTTTPISQQISTSPWDNFISTTLKNDEDVNADTDEEEDVDDPLNSEDFITVTPHIKSFGTKYHATWSTTSEDINEDNSSYDASGDQSIDISSLETIPQQMIKLNKSDFIPFTTTEITPIKLSKTISPNIDEDNIDNEHNEDVKDNVTEDEDEDEDATTTTTKMLNRVANTTDTYQIRDILERIDTITTTTTTKTTTTTTTIKQITTTNTQKQFNQVDLYENEENVNDESNLETEYIQLIPRKRYMHFNGNYLSNEQIWPAITSDYLVGLYGSISENLKQYETKKNCVCKNKQKKNNNNNNIQQHTLPWLKMVEVEAASTQNYIRLPPNSGVIEFEPTDQRIPFNDNIVAKFPTLNNGHFLPILP